jgi:Beta-propeller repeat
MASPAVHSGKRRPRAVGGPAELARRENWRGLDKGDKTLTMWFGRRGLFGAVAAALFLGLAQPALAGDQLQWVRQLGTPHDDVATGVATDGDGNVYIAGFTNGPLGGRHEGFLFDAWVAKY